MGWLNHRFGWHEVFSVTGALGFLTALVWFRMFHLPRQDPKVSKLEIRYIGSGGALIDQDARAPSDEGRPAREPALGFLSVRRFFESRMLVGIFLGQYCINGITWFFVSCFPSYLVNGPGVSILTAGLMAVLPALLSWIGSLSSGLFSDYLLSRIGSLSLARKIPITIGLLISCVIITCNYIHSEWLIVVVMSFALFEKGFGGALVWTVVADTAQEKWLG